MALLNTQYFIVKNKKFKYKTLAIVNTYGTLSGKNIEKEVNFFGVNKEYPLKEIEKVFEFLEELIL